MIFLRVSIVLLSVCLATWSSPLVIEKRTAAQVEADIASLTSALEKLDSDVNSLPQQGFIAVAAVEGDVSHIMAQLNETLADITSTGSVSTNDANPIFAAVKALVPKIIQTLEDFVTQKPEVVKLNGELSGLTELAETDLKALDSNISAVESALISAAPAALKPTGSILASSIHAAFETAIAAYAT